MRIPMIASWLLAGASLAHAAAVTTDTGSPALPLVAPNAATTVPDTDAIVVTDADDAADKIAYLTAASLIQQGQSELGAAMLDKLIPRMEKRYERRGRQVYCAHTTAEAAHYADIAAADRRPAVNVDVEFCDAWFMRGYARVDLHRPGEAEHDFAHAIALSPSHSHYLSEMGELHAQQHDWEAALAFYERARDAATPYSPDDLKVSELTRALRGIGYVDVELGRLDEAEAMYRQCLGLDPNDEKARGELGYVLAQRARASGQ